MVAKGGIIGLMIAALALSAPIVYADNGNGGNFSSGQSVQLAQSDQPTSKERHEWKHHGRGGHHLMAKVLNLTDDQKKQLKDIRQKQWDAMKSAFEQIKSNKQALNEEIVKSTPDMNKINDLQTQIKTIQSQMVDNRLNSMFEIKKIMSPEQFAGFMALNKEKMLIKAHGRHKVCRSCGHHQHWGDHKHWGNQGDEDRYSQENP